MSDIPFVTPSRADFSSLFQSQKFCITREIDETNTSIIDGRIILEKAETGEFLIYNSGVEANNFMDGIDDMLEEGNEVIIDEELNEYFTSYHPSSVNKAWLKCSNCDWIGSELEAEVITNVSERNDLGAIYSDLECPHCQAMLFLKDDEQNYPYAKYVTADDLKTLNLAGIIKDLQEGQVADIYADFPDIDLIDNDRDRKLVETLQNTQQAMHEAVQTLTFISEKLGLSSRADSQEHTGQTPH